MTGHLEAIHVVVLSAMVRSGRLPRRPTTAADYSTEVGFPPANFRVAGQLGPAPQLPSARHPAAIRGGDSLAKLAVGCRKVKPNRERGALSATVPKLV